MKEIESGEPAELQIEAPPGLLPNLSEWGLEEIERGVVEDTYENRRVIKQNKAQWNVVFDTDGMPTGYIQVVSAEMLAAAQALSKTKLLEDPEDYNSDYLSGLRLLLAEDSTSLAPTWVLKVTRTYMRQQDEMRALGPDADLYQTRLVNVPTRCSTVKADGTRCWQWSDGSTDTAGMCRLHARRAGRSPAIQISAAQLTRNRLQSAAPAAAAILEELAATAESESVRLGAANSLLDRTGNRGAIEVETKVEVTVNENAEEIRKRLEKLRKGQMERAKILQHVADVEAGEAETVEAEVIEDEQ
jgi:hypothetical protein